MIALPLRGLIAVTTLTLLAACATTPQPAQIEPQAESTQSATPARSDSAGIAQARADSMRYPYTEADVRFMTNMVGHHSQAIVMSRLAPTHTTNETIRTLAGRIVNAQSDEIAIIDQWLRDRRRPVPEPSADGHSTSMHSAHHGTLAPGMLTPEQMEKLDAARGDEFDRLFLTFMIQHHRGAVAMVKELFSTYGAGQDEIVFKFASDVNVDQTTEIERMEQMLVNMMFEDPSE